MYCACVHTKCQACTAHAFTRNVGMHCACVHTNSNLMRGFVANPPPPPPTLPPLISSNPAKGRNSTSILHVPLWLERHQSVFTHVRRRSFLSVRLRIFLQSPLRIKKNQSWNKENGMTEIRTANPSSEIVELPTRPRGTWRFRSVDEHRRKKKKTNNCSTSRAPRINALFSPNYNPTLTLTLDEKLRRCCFSSPYSVAWVTRAARAGWRWNSCP